MSAAPFETADTLNGLAGIAHGYFGRIGPDGAAQFDMSETLGTDLTIVADNRASACAALGVGDTQLISLRQTHSSDVLTLTEPPDRDAKPEADGVVTATAGLALSILTADCAPLLFADAEAGVIGACHAGWKGAVGGVVGNTIAAMAALGASTDRIVGAIGPTISGPNYEVGPEFADSILAQSPVAKDFLFVPDCKTRAHFDLPGFAMQMAAEAGVRNVERVGGCTFGHPDRYYSHRQTAQNGLEAGRQIAIIALR